MLLHALLHNRSSQWAMGGARRRSWFLEIWKGGGLRRIPSPTASQGGRRSSIDGTQLVGRLFDVADARLAGEHVVRLIERGIDLVRDRCCQCVVSDGMARRAAEASRWGQFRVFEARLQGYF